jgi:hypothetical protein
MKLLFLMDFFTKVSVLWCQIIMQFLDISSNSQHKVNNASLWIPSNLHLTLSTDAMEYHEVWVVLWCLPFGTCCKYYNLKWNAECHCSCYTKREAEPEGDVTRRLTKVLEFPRWNYCSWWTSLQKSAYYGTKNSLHLTLSTDGMEYHEVWVVLWCLPFGTCCKYFHVCETWNPYGGSKWQWTSICVCKFQRFRGTRQWR